MMSKNSFDSNDPLAYERLRRRRAFAESMMEAGLNSAPKTIPEGVNSFAKSIAGALIARGLERKEDAAHAAADPAERTAAATLLESEESPSPPDARIAASDRKAFDAAPSATAGEAVERAFLAAGVDDSDADLLAHNPAMSLSELQALETDGLSDAPHDPLVKREDELHNDLEMPSAGEAAASISSSTPDAMLLPDATTVNGDAVAEMPSAASDHAPYSMYFLDDDLWNASMNRIDTNPFVSDGEKNVARALLLNRYHRPTGVGEAALP